MSVKLSHQPKDVDVCILLRMIYVWMEEAVRTTDTWKWRRMWSQTLMDLPESPW